MQVHKPDQTTRKRVKQLRATAVKLLCSAAPIAGVKMRKFRERQCLELEEHNASIALQVTYTSELVSYSRVCVQCVCVTHVCYVRVCAIFPYLL